MTVRKPLVIGGDGLSQQLQAGDKLSGTLAKAIATAANGTITATIPAGIFLALPVIKHTIQTTRTRDYVFRLSGLTLNADKTITVTGVVRQSQALLALGDPFAALTAAVTLHLSAEESD